MYLSCQDVCGVKPDLLIIHPNLIKRIFWYEVVSCNWSSLIHWFTHAVRGLMLFFPNFPDILFYSRLKLWITETMFILHHIVPVRKSICLCKNTKYGRAILNRITGGKGTALPYMVISSLTSIYASRHIYTFESCKREKEVGFFDYRSHFKRLKLCIMLNFPVWSPTFFQYMFQHHTRPFTIFLGM